MRAPIAAVAVAFVLAALGCSDKSRYVAVEMNMDADLRVVAVAATTGEKMIVILGKDDAFQYPLKDVFAKNGTLKVAVVAFSASAVTDAYPALKGQSTAALKTAIKPDFGAPAAGAYEIPTPLRILTAALEPSGTTDVAYRETALQDLMMDPDLRFIFRLDPSSVCARGDDPIRVFARSDPGTVCAFVRDQGCAWQPSADGPCQSLSAIFGLPIDPADALREVPPRLLIDAAGRLSCPIVQETPLLGETVRFDCTRSGGRIVSLQEAPRTADGVTWQPNAGVSGGMLAAKGGVFATGEKGALYAYSDGAQIALQRLSVETQQVSPQSIVFQSGLSAINFSVDLAWVGPPKRLTANQTHDQVVISGDQGAAVMLYDASAPAESDQKLAFYKYPALEIGESAVPRSARAGDVVNGPGAIAYALLRTGISVLRVSGNAVMKIQETPQGMIAPIDPLLHPQIAAVKNAPAQGAAEERVVVWADDGRTIVFDGAGVPKLTCTVSGAIMSAYDGPTLVRKSSASRFTLDLLDLGGAESNGGCGALAMPKKSYLVPPNRQALAAGTDVVLDLSAYVASNNREVLAYRYGHDVGVLDLGSGLSQAITIDRDPALSVLFEDVGRTTLWGAFASRTAADYASIHFPILKEAP